MISVRIKDMEYQIPSRDEKQQNYLPVIDHSKKELTPEEKILTEMHGKINRVGFIQSHALNIILAERILELEGELKHVKPTSNP